VFKETGSATYSYNKAEKKITMKYNKKKLVMYVGSTRAFLDGVEVYTTASTKNTKRMTADIDAGYVSLTNKLGHALYRNVDQKATEALPENKGKLVYSYALGVESSTDPSGIDAEASMKNGAHIIFKDTNNSTDDFHERVKCSLRD